jgi:adenylate cyclase
MEAKKFRRILDYLSEKGGLRLKLSVGVTLILAFTVYSIVSISTRLQVDDTRDFVLKASSDSAALLANQFDQEIRKTLELSQSYLDLGRESEARLTDVLSRRSEILALRGIDLVSNKIERSFISPKGKGHGIEGSGLLMLDLENPDSITLRKDAKSSYSIKLVFPWKQDSSGNVTGIGVVDIDPSHFNTIFKLDESSHLLLFGEDGKILFSSANSIVEGVVDAQNAPPALVQANKSSPLNNFQVRVLGKNESPFIGSLKKTQIAGLAISVLIPEARIYDTPNKIRARSVFLGLAILCLALLATVLFADTITQPLLKLVEVTKKIASGDFNVRSESKKHDEIGTLSKSFDQMAEGLSEREKLKNLFGKFHSKAVAEKLMHDKEAGLGGERIPVTVFFSDIRSFTSRSENMSAEEVVAMLNEYMTEMVSVIEEYNGVVDKYVGDAIMAIWGIGSNDPQFEAEQAIRACLAMRQKLGELNERRIARGDDEIKIGMGLNSGEAVAGNIGSPSRMEYTVIGDAVNTASRVESLTKEYETDLLVSSTTAELVKRLGLSFSEPFQAAAKGKSGGISVHKCEEHKEPASDDDTGTPLAA